MSQEKDVKCPENCGKTVAKIANGNLLIWCKSCKKPQVFTREMLKDLLEYIQ